MHHTDDRWRRCKSHLVCGTCHCGLYATCHSGCTQARHTRHRHRTHRPERHQNASMQAASTQRHTYTPLCVCVYRECLHTKTCTHTIAHKTHTIDIHDTHTHTNTCDTHTHTFTIHTHCTHKHTLTTQAKTRTETRDRCNPPEMHTRHMLSTSSQNSI